MTVWRTHLAAGYWWLKEVHQPVLITSWPSVLFWSRNDITALAKSATCSFLLQRYRRLYVQVLHRCIPEQQNTLKIWYTIVLWWNFGIYDAILSSRDTKHTKKRFYGLTGFNSGFLCANSLKMFTLNLSQVFYFLAAISHGNFPSTSPVLLDSVSQTKFLLKVINKL